MTFNTLIHKSVSCYLKIITSSSGSDVFEYPGITLKAHAFMCLCVVNLDTKNKSTLQNLFAAQ